MSEDLLKQLQANGDVLRHIEAQAAEIARLRATISQIMTPGDNYKRLNAALATARREGMAEAADLCDDLPDHQGGICAIAIRMMIDEEDKKAAIRAAALEGEKDE